MSRILRRPMFRGGRVDARGTGIASGLGYNNGGRVGYDNGGLTLQQQKDKSAYLSNRARNKKFTYDSVRDRMQAYYDNLYLGGMNEGDIDMGLQISPYMSPDDIAEANYFEQTPKKFEKDFFSGIIGGTNYDDIMKSLSSGAKLAGEENLYIKPGEEIVSSQSEENGSNNLTGGDGLPEKTKAEKLEEYQALFEEAYGTGRGEDISNMLLSFAGKALKPEATVKSSFGEFFEDEAKRPSESKKYKDAATTAAINAFLTGEKTMAEVDTYLAKVKAGEQIKYDIAADTQKNMSLTDYVRVNKKSGDRVSQVLESGIRSKIQNFPEKYKAFKKIKSKKNTENLLDEEYLGMIFWDEGTEEIFAVVMGAQGKPIKEPLY